MKTRTVCCTLLLCLLAASSASAQGLTKTGTTAAAFLKIAIGPRAVGMGGAFTATANDVSAMYWNPGGLGFSYGSEAAFNHVRWFADVNINYAAVATRLSEIGTFGAFVTVMSMDEMLVRTIEQPEGTGERFGAGGLAIGVMYARSLTDNFSIGFNVKYIREYLWHQDATGIGLDVGVLYKIPVLNELRLGAVVSNFGSKLQLSGRDNLSIQQIGGTEGNLINTYVEMDEFDLPLLFRVGVAADVVKSDDLRLTTAVDAVHPNDNTEYLNAGLEAGWNEMLFLRVGWKSFLERDTEQGFTAGIGVSPKIVGALAVSVDYAYQDFGRLTNVHYLSVGVRF